jgi:hypothetical protein
MDTTHKLELELEDTPESKVDAGAEIRLRVGISCASGCELSPVPIEVTTDDGVVLVQQLDSGEDEAEKVLILTAPSSVGEHRWTLTVPGHEVEGILHEACSLSVEFRTRAHVTSMAVWEIPSAVVMGAEFKVQVGVKCSAECPLTGGRFEVLNDEGAPVSGGDLGELPSPGTRALYPAYAGMAAPLAEAVSNWSVRFIPESVVLPHTEAIATFSFPTVRAPEHRVTITLREEGTGTPLEHADVKLGAYRASTDAGGHAVLELPKGSYPLNVWKHGYHPLSQTVAVDNDVEMDIDASVARDVDADEEQVWM